MINVRALIVHGKRREILARAEFLDRTGRGSLVVFFVGTDILLKEILRSFLSALSMYRISRGGSFAFFTRTDSLLTEAPLNVSGLRGANGVPGRGWSTRIRKPQGKGG